MKGLTNQFSLIEYQDLKFLIFDAPSNVVIDLYIQELKKHNVSQIGTSLITSSSM